MKHFDTDSTTQYQGYTVKIQHDDSPMHPRHDCDNADTMLCREHRRYNLGDEQADDETIQEKIKELERTGGIFLPLYLYEHSGITMNTKPFSCPWDSSMAGIIFMDRETILKEFGIKRVTKSVREKAIACMQASVKVYDYFITGNAWGYSIEDEHGEDIDSCWGFLGDGFDGSLDHLENYIINAIECDQNSKRKEKLERTKVWVKNKVPLNVRQQLANS